MLTSNEIANKRFETIRKGGYNAAEVDGFLAEAAKTLSQLKAENTELKRKAEALGKKVEAFEDDQSSLSQALLSAQKLADTLVRDAQTKADLTLRDAEIKAEKSQEKYERIRQAQQDEFDRMKKEIVDFRNRILDMYKEHIQTILKIPDEKLLGPLSEPQREEDAQGVLSQAAQQGEAGAPQEASAMEKPAEKPADDSAQGPETGKNGQNPAGQPEPRGKFASPGRDAAIPSGGPGIKPAKTDNTNSGAASAQDRRTLEAAATAGASRQAREKAGAPAADHPQGGHRNSAGSDGIHLNLAYDEQKDEYLPIEDDGETIGSPDLDIDEDEEFHTYMNGSGRGKK